MMEPWGEQLPVMRTPAPGPTSRALAQRLARVESRNITRISNEAAPIFWEEARGANVRDADGNVYIDLTAGFGVAVAGHANPHVAGAIAEQSARLMHALGDVHPGEPKVRLLEKLAEIAPGPLGVSILASSGAEAVEAALKTALLHTGRPGVIAFRGAYHGLTYGALAATWRAEFRDPFREQLFAGVRFAGFPVGDGEWGEAVGSADVSGPVHEPTHPGGDLASNIGGDAGQSHSTPGQPSPLDATIAELEQLLAEADASPYPIGALLVEPVQGRGGFIVPPHGFLAALRELCDRRRIILIFDEVYTGLGRTGRWFACEREGVVPDILVVGKSLAGGLPLSAAIGTPEVMQAWPPSTGEAIHTSTFLGNPVACAAALANLAEIETRALVARAATLGDRIRRRCSAWRERSPYVGDVRGIGLMQGVELVEPTTGEPATALAGAIVQRLLDTGVIMLTEGEHANILAFTPPLVITDMQLEFALDAVERELADATAPAP